MLKMHDLYFISGSHSYDIIVDKKNNLHHDSREENICLLSLVLSQLQILPQSDTIVFNMQRHAKLPPLPIKLAYSMVYICKLVFAAW